MDYTIMGARLYDRVTGRFLSADLLLDAFPRHSPYNFAYNNPLTWRDPSGLAPEKVDKGGGARKQEIDYWQEYHYLFHHRDSPLPARYYPVEAGWYYDGEGFSNFSMLKVPQKEDKGGSGGGSFNIDISYTENLDGSVSGNINIDSDDGCFSYSFEGVKNQDGLIDITSNSAPSFDPKNSGLTQDEFLDGVQTALGVMGQLPGFGEFADVANGMISLARGDYWVAASQFASAIPVAGNFIAAAKFAGAGGLMILKGGSLLTKPSGSYMLKFASGKYYIGKGLESRMHQSASRIYNRYGDNLIESQFFKHANSRDAFIHEYEMIVKYGFDPDKNINFYNQIWSPCKKILGK